MRRARSAPAPPQAPSRSSIASSAALSPLLPPPPPPSARAPVRLRARCAVPQPCRLSWSAARRACTTARSPRPLLLSEYPASLHQAPPRSIRSASALELPLARKRLRQIGRTRQHSIGMLLSQYPPALAEHLSWIRSASAYLPSRKRRSPGASRSVRSGHGSRSGTGSLSQNAPGPSGRRVGARGRAMAGPVRRHGPAPPAPRPTRRKAGPGSGGVWPQLEALGTPKGFACAPLLVAAGDPRPAAPPRGRRRELPARTRPAEAQPLSLVRLE